MASPARRKPRPSPAPARRLALDAAARRVRAWQRAGERVVFTNGVFDLLHPGHLKILRKSRAQGDRLVVGLNSDASVRRLKGPTRPVQPQGARAAVLCALRDVDLVVLFSQDTPLVLIRKLRPDVLVKGGDYTLEQIVGAREVLASGGRVVRVPLVRAPLASTTRLIGKARKP